jgi:hypothetical protein
MTAFYEKVIKVKADVAAILVELTLTASAVKGVRRTFILTLDRDRRHQTLGAGTKRNRSRSASFLIGKNIVSVLLRVESSEKLDGASTLPAFYPHSEWAIVVRCILGSDFTSQVRHRVTDLGC